MANNYAYGNQYASSNSRQQAPQLPARQSYQAAGQPSTSPYYGLESNPPASNSYVSSAYQPQQTQHYVQQSQDVAANNIAWYGNQYGRSTGSHGGSALDKEDSGSHNQGTNSRFGGNAGNDAARLGNIAYASSLNYGSGGEITQQHDNRQYATQSYDGLKIQDSTAHSQLPKPTARISEPARPTSAASSRSTASQAPASYAQHRTPSDTMWTQSSQNYTLPVPSPGYSNPQGVNAGQPRSAMSSATQQTAPTYVSTSSSRQESSSILERYASPCGPDQTQEQLIRTHNQRYPSQVHQSQQPQRPQRTETPAVSRPDPKSTPIPLQGNTRMPANHGSKRVVGLPPSTHLQGTPSQKPVAHHRQLPVTKPTSEELSLGTFGLIKSPMSIEAQDRSSSHQYQPPNVATQDSKTPAPYNPQQEALTTSQQPARAVSPPISMTVDPSHVYNRYHEYRKQIEAAEAEEARLLALKTAASSSEAAITPATVTEPRDTAPAENMKPKTPNATAGKPVNTQAISSVQSSLPATPAATSLSTTQPPLAVTDKPNSSSNVPSQSVETKADGADVINDEKSVAVLAMEAEMRAMVEKMREYQTRDPKLFSHVWESVRKGQGSQPSPTPTTATINRAQVNSPTPSTVPPASNSVNITATVTPEQSSTVAPNIPGKKEGEAGTPASGSGKAKRVRPPRTKAAPAERAALNLAKKVLGAVTAHDQEKSDVQPQDGGSNASPIVRPRPASQFQTPESRIIPPARKVSTAGTPGGSSSHPTANTSSLSIPPAPSSLPGSDGEKGLEKEVSIDPALQRPRASASYPESLVSGPNIPAPQTATPRLDNSTPPTDSRRRLTVTKKSSVLWPEIHRPVLATTAATVLNSLEENQGKTLLAHQVRGMLDENPSYVELCDMLGHLGFKMDRARFAKTLLSCISNFSGPPKEHPPQRREETILPGGARGASNGPAQQGYALVTSAGNTPYQPGTSMNQESSNAPPSASPAVQEVGPRRGEGLQLNRAGSSSQQSHQRTSRFPENATLEAHDVESERLWQKPLYQDLQQTRQPYRSPFSQEMAPPRQTQHPNARQLPNADWRLDPNNPGVKLLFSRGDALKSGATPLASIPVPKATPPSHAFHSHAIPSTTKPTTPVPLAPLAPGAPPATPAPLTKEMAARKRTFAEIIDLTSADDVLESIESEDSSDKVSKFRRIGDNDKAAVRARESAQTCFVSHVTQGLTEEPRKAPLQPDVQPPSSSSKQPALKPAEIVSPEVSNPLYFSNVVRPIERSFALRKSRYDPKTIARDVLIASSTHPIQRGLNSHLEKLQESFALVNRSSDLSSFDWNLVDPGGLPVGANMSAYEKNEKQNAQHLPFTSSRTSATEHIPLVTRTNPITPSRGVMDSSQPRGRPPGWRTDPTPSIPSGLRQESSANPEDVEEDYREALEFLAVDEPAAPTVRRRGPGRKFIVPVSVEVGSPASARRGRPPKSISVASNDDVEMGSTASTRRGRPPKSVSVVSNDDVEIEGSPLPTRRGRPPKTDSKPARASPPSAKKRGRPFQNGFGPKTTQPLIPKKRGRPLKMTYDETLNELEKDLSELPVRGRYVPFLCEWAGCDVELQNLDSLRQHILTVHGKRNKRKPLSCLWSTCGTNEESSQKFEGLEDFKDHLEKTHLTSFAWHMGDGPKGSSLSTDARNSSRHPWLYDRDGRQITPSVDDQVVETGWPSDNAARRTAEGSVIIDPLLEDVSGINLLIPEWEVPTGPYEFHINDPEYSVLKIYYTEKWKLEAEAKEKETKSTVSSSEDPPKASSQS